MAGAVDAKAAPVAASTERIGDVAVAVTWANIRGQYGRVWVRLHPAHQRVTSRAFWESCQRKRAAATAGIDWLSIKATATYPDRVVVPVLGLTRVTAVTITARYKYLGSRHTESDTNYWKRVNGIWRGLWQPETYRAYKTGHCPPT
jgi:hypothetical protein